MTAEFVYLPALLLIGLGILFIGAFANRASTVVTANEVISSADSLGPAPVDAAPIRTNDTARQSMATAPSPAFLNTVPDQEPPSIAEAPTVSPTTFVPPIMTDTQNPAVITDYEEGEGLIIELPHDLTDDTASAELSTNGQNTEIKVGNQTIAILQGYTNIDGLNAQFVQMPDIDPPKDSATNGTPVDLHQDGFTVQTVALGDDVVTVPDFDITQDQLEIGTGEKLSFVAANAGADTTVLIDGIAVFLLQGVTPADMAHVKVTKAA